MPAETQAALLERAGGNPLYAEQFVRMLSEAGPSTGTALPETVQALIAARLDTLTPELKSLLQDASVLGKVFWTGALVSMGASCLATMCCSACASSSAASSSVLRACRR